MDKYEEALQKARDLYGGVHSTNKAVLEQIFPELAESEDEKTRCAIISLVKNCNIIDINISHERMLTWLEKQKEQKPVEWSEEDEKMIRDILFDLRELRDDETEEQLREEYSNEINWLKSLRPQPHWKPSEDERFIKAILHILYENYTDAAIIEGVEIAEIVTWLHDIRNKNI